MYKHARTHTHIYTYSHIHTYIYTCVHTDTHIFTHTQYIHMHKHITRICTHVHGHTYTYTLKINKIKSLIVKVVKTEEPSAPTFADSANPWETSYPGPAQVTHSTFSGALKMGIS